MYVGAEIATGNEMCFIGQAIEFLCRLEKRGERCAFIYVGRKPIEVEASNLPHMHAA